jgi:hypothetical protein
MNHGRNVVAITEACHFGSIGHVEMLEKDAGSDEVAEEPGFPIRAEVGEDAVLPHVDKRLRGTKADKAEPTGDENHASSEFNKTVWLVEFALDPRNPTS